MKKLVIWIKYTLGLQKFISWAEVLSPNNERDRREEIKKARKKEYNRTMMDIPYDPYEYIWCSAWWCALIPITIMIKYDENDGCIIILMHTASKKPKTGRFQASSSLLRDTYPSACLSCMQSTLSFSKKERYVHMCTYISLLACVLAFPLVHLCCALI